MKQRIESLLPPAFLGILGGGQLGRFFTQAAQDLGYKVCVLDPDPLSPAGAIADKHIRADYEEPSALSEMANICQAVSTEFENVPAKTLDYFVSRGLLVSPLSFAVSIAQDRIAEKSFLNTPDHAAGIKSAPYHTLLEEVDLATVDSHLFPGILKTARLGYDGKGQVFVAHSRDLRAAWQAIGNVPAVLEKKLQLAYEISALVVRGRDDEIKLYPLAENQHVGGILHLSLVPAPSITTEIERKINEATIQIVKHLDYVGVLCIEYFVLTDGEIVTNEVAPRPHNSGHYTLDACVTSQFEQQVRALAGLPLGSTELLCPAVMLNLLGDIWPTSTDEVVQPPWHLVLNQPMNKLHLYGKSEPKIGRKMGHITILGKSTQSIMASIQQTITNLGMD